MNLQAIERASFHFNFDPEAGEFRLGSARGCLRLACQGAVSRPGVPDTGIAWAFLDATEHDDAVTWRFAAESSLWQRKFLKVTITARELLFHLEVEGDGDIDRATFFAGFGPDLQVQNKAAFGHLAGARPAWQRQWTGSPLTFAAVLNPQPRAPDPQQMPATVPQRITCATTFGPETYNTFFAPPLYAYVFDNTFCIGVASRIGASRFNHFDYTATAGWGMELNFDGQTRVEGTWRSPALRVAVCADADSGLRDYAEYLRDSGLAPQPARDIPEWAFRPMICGWGQQTAWANQASHGAALPVASPITPGAGGFASQSAYEEIVRLLEARDLPYGTLTVDMGWSRCLTVPRPDERLWPDMKGFIERLHRQGKRVFLWLATWNPGGLDEELRMPHDRGLADCCDPTSLEFRRQLADAVEQAVGPDGLNADGFKIDFTGDLPRGGYRPAGNLWGLDLMHDYLKLIHDAMKAAKGDTVLETHCANPQFADVTEMLRLNDLFCTREDVRPDMQFRARMARIALPGLPIDTDNDPFISRQAWMEYMRLQPSIGLPSLYTLTHMSFCAPGQPAESIAGADWDEVRALWKDYEAGRQATQETEKFRQKNEWAER